MATSDEVTLRIVPRPTPGRMPVLMWGGYSPSSAEAERQRLLDIGFTHVLGLRADYDRLWEADGVIPPDEPDDVAAAREMLDDALAHDLSIAATLSPGSWLRRKEKYHRVDREGKAYGGDRHDICALFPEIEAYCRRVGESVGQAYGSFPAFDAALLHTEVRGHARPCFHEHDIAAFREEAGIDIPPQPQHPRGLRYEKLEGFPAMRVIGDDHPIYRYYRWYWKEGDGWNGLNTALNRGLKAGLPPKRRDGFWTFHDPAVRVASVYGSGGDVDVISQWTYSYPDPIRIGLATDELMAMAAGGRQGQRVMKMTQIIWYRGQTAPEPKSAEDALPYRAEWEREQPDAPFITIPPMHLREAFWTKIARPIQGIMYHGWQSLVPCEPKRAYRFTHPQTRHELARLVDTVVRPLGPMLRAVPGVKSDVAMLECFASEMFARRGTYGWNGSWAGDMYHVLKWARLQPDIVFDETVIAGGLEDYRVLVMPDCDVITQSMLEEIRAFQQRGGLIIGDERTTPAVRPDILVPLYARTGQNQRDKAALQELAAGLRADLAGRYAWYVDTSNGEVVPHRRRYRHTDYVFLVNDHRAYGNYVGHHGIVMENGLPSRATVTVRRPAASGEPDGGYVYALPAGRNVPTRATDEGLRFDVDLGPCSGGIWMITPQSIHAVTIDGPAAINRGGSGELTIEVVDPAGVPMPAILPLHVDIRDAEGRRAEMSGHWAAVDGRVVIPLDIAPNEVPGAWYIEVEELASGRTATHHLEVPGPKPWPPREQQGSEELANPEQPKG
jgi:hypothetical protein